MYGFSKHQTRNEHSKNDSHSSEDDCAEVKQKQTNGRNHEEVNVDVSLNDV